MNAARVQSTIDAVTVYRSGARVRRVGRVEPGEEGALGAVHLPGLPLALADGSVRVAVEPDDPDDGAELPVAVDVRVLLDLPDDDGALPPPRDAELEAAEVEEARIGAAIEQIETDLARARGLSLAPRPDGAEGEPPGPTPLEARLALVAFGAAREEALRGELATLRARHDEALRRLEVLRARWRLASSARQPEPHALRKTVAVSLGGGVTARPFRVSVEYVVPGARWAPAYTGRLEPAGAASLAMRALVRQRTGEDWRGVALTLSTADAMGWHELPELQSVRVGRRQERRPRPGWRAPPSGAAELYEDHDRAIRRLRGAFALELEGDDEGEILAGAAPDDPFADQQAEEMPWAPPESSADHAVMVQAPPAPRSRSLIGGLGSLVGGRSSPPPPPSMPAPSPASKPKAAPARGGAAPGIARTEMMALPPEPEEAEPGAALLDYGALRMPAPRSAERGRLIVAQKQSLYLSLLVEQGVEVSLDVDGVLRGAVAAADAPGAPAPAGCAWAWSEAFDYAYPCESRVDVPSDGETHSIPVITRATEARFSHVTVPREASEVFRIATLHNPLDAPLLSGPMDVYLGDQFLLTAPVHTTAAGGVLRLGLGVEQGIKVARNTSFREATSGLLGGSLALEHEIRVEVANNLARPVKVEVRERVPAVREGEGEIEVTSRAEPPWQPWEPEPERPGEPTLRGGHRWLLSLDAGETRALRASYAIRVSAKLELVGGNRREDA